MIYNIKIRVVISFSLPSLLARRWPLPLPNNFLRFCLAVVLKQALKPLLFQVLLHS